MTEELATVISISDKQVTLTSQIKSTCSGCSQVDSCANGQVSKALPKQQMKVTLNLPATSSLKVGDSVILGIPEGDLLTSAGQVYLLPLLGLIGASAAGQWLIDLKVINHELLSFLIGITGGYLGYVFAKYLQKTHKYAEKLEPKILRVIVKPRG